MDIAIIGMALNLPTAETKEEFWEILENGKDCIRPLPPEREKKLRAYLSHSGLASWEDTVPEGAYLDDIERFPHQRFHLSKREANLMDPSHRLFLRAAARAFEDAGYTQEQVNGSNTGVFVGYLGSGDYYTMIETMEPESLSTAFLGNCSSALPGRLSHMLNLRGPNMTIGTSCSSSLTAMHAACRSLRQRECDAAIVGGVQVYPLPIRKTRIGIESASGRSKPFSQEADGTGGGEGVIVLLLKPYNAARANRDNIYARIKGSAVNHDGTSIGLSAPNPSAQAEVLMRAWKDAGVSPRTISYIEAHGTGTQLGDPIEIAGITKAFRHFTNDTGFCAVSSVKSNMGHLDAAAGIAGVVKAIMQMQKKMIAPTVHYRDPNPSIDFQNSPVYVSAERSMPWHRGRHPRRCGVSSFGVSGSNCHIVLEEHEERQAKRRNHNERGFVFTLSGDHLNELIVLLSIYEKFVIRQSDVSLEDICYTVNLSRAHRACRVGMVVRSRDDLIAKLRLARRCLPHSDDRAMIFYGEVNAGSSRAKSSNIWGKKARGQRARIELIKAYVSGESVCWKAQYTRSAHKTSLPFYPEQEASCWISLNGKEELRQDDGGSQTEAVLSRLFAQVLGSESVSAEDHFYHLGGDSILALELIHAIERELGVSISIEDVYQNPTVAQLQMIINRKHPDDMREGSADFAHIMEYPLSLAQRRLYAHALLFGKTAQYNITSVFRIAGVLHIDRLKRCWGELVSRHDSLRTSFHLSGKEVVQRVNADIEATLSVVEETDIDDAAKWDPSRYIRPFSLESPSMLRAFLIPVSSNEHYFFSDMHHIITDGISNSLIMRELIQLYNGDSLPRPASQYGDYVRWQMMQNHDVEGQKRKRDFWLQHLHGFKRGGSFPHDRMDNVESRRRCVNLIFAWETSLHDQVVLFAKAYRITPFSLLFTTFAMLLCILTDTDDTVIGTTVSGRMKKEFSQIVGLCANTLAIRFRDMHGFTYVTYLSRVSEELNRAYAYQDYSFEKLASDHDVEINMDGNPFFSMLFLMQNYPHSLKNETLTIERLPVREGESEFDVTVNVYQDDDGELQTQWSYAVGRYTEAAIRKIWMEYTALLRYGIENPHALFEEMKRLVLSNAPDDVTN